MPNLGVSKSLTRSGNPIERAFLATGIVPLSPPDLHHAHPTIFRSPKAAEHALRNYPRNLNSNPIWDCGAFSFRRDGQRGPEAKALIDRDPSQEAQIAALEASIGCKLRVFEGVALPCSTELPAAGPVIGPEPWATPSPQQPGRGAAPPSIMVHGPPDA